jgi:hypothetical protein
MKNIFWLLQIFVVLAVFSSCTENSNELAPITSREKFVKTITYNEGAFMNASIEEKIRIGADSLKIKFANPSGNVLQNIKIAVYFQTSETFAEAIRYRNIININSLAPMEDTTVIILNHPELPVKEDKMFIRLLAEDNIHFNLFSGVYDGNSGYYFDADSVPSVYSFSKGIIEADGSFSLWMKLNDLNKKITGRLVDTLGISNGFMQQGSSQFVAGLDTIAGGTHFLEDSATVKFMLNISPQQADLEKKIKFTLYR